MSSACCCPYSEPPYEEYYAIHLFRQMLKQGVINKDEYNKIDTKMIEKYKVPPYVKTKKAKIIMTK